MLFDRVRHDTRTSTRFCHGVVHEQQNLPVNHAENRVLQRVDDIVVEVEMMLLINRWSIRVEGLPLSGQMIRQMLQNIRAGLPGEAVQSGSLQNRAQLANMANIGSAQAEIGAHIAVQQIQEAIQIIPPHQRADTHAYFDQGFSLQNLQSLSYCTAPDTELQSQLLFRRQHIPITERAVQDALFERFDY